MDEVNATSKEYVITKHGRPVARLVPPDPVAQSAFGFLAGTVTENEDIVAPDFSAWHDLPIVTADRLMVDYSEMNPAVAVIDAS